MGAPAMLDGDWLFEPSLREYASARQLQFIDAVIKHKTMRKAAEALGVMPSVISESLRACRVRAAKYGRAPGHFNDGTAPGYRMGKVTIQRGPKGVERVWERQSPDHETREAALKAACDAMAEELPRLDPLERPATTFPHLCNLFTFTDFHLGMLAWHKEGGADWDLKIAERVLIQAFEQMLVGSPRAAAAVVNIQGDFLHTDGLVPITPQNHHVLDADGRFSKIIAVAIRAIRRLCDIALMRHDRVHVLIAEGNHDMASSLWLRQMFAALYENEPRLTVNASELPYYVYQHGKTMLAFHHGHLKKNDQLPLLFAAQFPLIWGATTKRYCHTGHRHHIDEKEHAGMIVVQHPTLAARDAYAARGGWISERQAQAITYHDEFGEVARNIVTPEMLAA